MKRFTKAQLEKMLEHARAEVRELQREVRRLTPPDHAGLMLERQAAEFIDSFPGNLRATQKTRATARAARMRAVQPKGSAKAKAMRDQENAPLCERIWGLRRDGAGWKQMPVPEKRAKRLCAAHEARTCECFKTK